MLERTTLSPAGRRTLSSDARSLVSGNPMYMSLTIVYAGVALALGKTWWLVLVVLPWAATES